MDKSQAAGTIELNTSTVPRISDTGVQGAVAVLDAEGSIQDGLPEGKFSFSSVRSEGADVVPFRDDAIFLPLSAQDADPGVDVPVALDTPSADGLVQPDDGEWADLFAQDASAQSAPDAFGAPRSFESSQAQRPRTSSFARTLGVSAGLVLAALAVGVLFGTLMRGDQEPVSPSSAASSSSAPAVASASASASSSAAPVDVHTVLSVKAPGYSQDASPLVYHISGVAKVDRSSQKVDLYGFVDPTLLQKDAGGNDQADTFVVDLGPDMLAEGSYTISWSNSILPDGSYYRVPEQRDFTVAGEEQDMEFVFEKVDGTKAAAKDVKAVYDDLSRWLDSATGEVASQKASILDLAKANANAAASVVAAGGLDNVGKESSSSSEPRETEQRDEDDGAEQPEADDQEEEVVIITYVDEPTTTDDGGTGYVQPVEEPTTPAEEPATPTEEPATEPAEEPVEPIDDLPSWTDNTDTAPTDSGDSGVGDVTGE